MKLSLSLKILFCLLLNVALLGVVGAGFLTGWGGGGWSSLLSGPAGQRMQTLGSIVAGEVLAASPADRDAVLGRFETVYGAEFFVLGRGGVLLAGDAARLPEAVRPVLGLRPSGEPRFPRVPEVGFGGEFHEFAGPPMEPPEPRGERPQVPEPGRSRTLVRAGEPVAYWLSLRVEPGHPMARPAPGMAGGAMARPERIVVRVATLWGVVRLLELQPWVLGSSAALLLSAIVWWPLMRGIARAIRELTAATERIAEGRFDLAAPAERNDELGRLGESVNRMATRIDSLLTGQKRFLGDVAHELCSPLARLQMSMGILETRATPELRGAVEDAREEVQQMAELVNDLLDFTRAGLRVAQRYEFELAPVLAQVLAREAGGKTLRCEVPDGLRLWGDPALLARALGNLVRNAVRYAGEAGPIQIVASAEDAGVWLSVLDEGPGVPADELPRLGEPFFRPEVARTREGGGVGLGLAIVIGAVQGCGGKIRFSNRSPRGFAAEIFMPSRPVEAR